MTDSTTSTELVSLEDQLTQDREGSFVDALGDGADIVEAGRVAAYPDGGSAAGVARREPVQKAVKSLVESKIRTEGLGLAYREMKKILTHGAPPAAKIAAAKWMFAAAGVGQGDDDDDVPVQEMTEAQLARFIARAERVVQRGGAPQVINVTPKKGA